MALAQISVMATNLPKISVVEDDPEDDVIVATAVAVKADYLVTGDPKHLLPLGACEGITIVTPRALLDELAKGTARKPIVPR